MRGREGCCVFKEGKGLVATAGRVEGEAGGVAGGEWKGQVKNGSEAGDVLVQKGADSGLCVGWRV